MRTDPAVAGALRIGGVDANELAALYGTPLLVLDGERLDASIATFTDAQRDLGIEISYAAKALFFIALARRIARADLGIDVCSLGELLTAERARVSPTRLTLHGCGKTDEELRAACAGRVGRIVIDGREEIERLAPIAKASARAALDVVIRVNTGLEAHTHAYVRTAGEDSKFGVSSGALDDAIEAILRVPALRLCGVHTHIGSQILDPDAFVENVPLALDTYERVLVRAPDARTLILGGGFGVESDPNSARFDMSRTLERIAAAVAGGVRARGIPAPQMGLEPGRAVVAEAGTSLYRVVAVKQNGSRRFAIVDGSIADNPRPALYGAFHHPHIAGRTSGAAPVAFSICGRSCESDRLVDAPLPGDLTAGDLVALDTTGAYTYSMASNYNRFGRPAIVVAERGTHRPVVRREEASDLLRHDVDDPN